MRPVDLRVTKCACEEGLGGEASRGGLTGRSQNSPLIATHPRVRGTRRDEWKPPSNNYLGFVGDQAIRESYVQNGPEEPVFG